MPIVLHALLFVLLSAAQASPQSELLRLMDETDADPVVAVSCHPVAPLTRLLETIDLPGFNPRESPEGSWMSLLTPTRLASAGVDVSDSLSVLFFGDRDLIVDVGFSGSERQASAVVASLLGLGEATLGTFGWRDGEFVVGGRRLPDDIVDITLHDGRLTVRTGIPSTSGPTSLRDIVRRPDPGSGCAMTFDGPLPRGERAKRRGRAPTHVTGIVHVPLSDGAPATVRFRTAEPVPTALHAEPRAPIGGSTTESPVVLMSIGVSIGDLLLDPSLRATLDIPEAIVVELLSRVRLGAGSTVAFFADEPRLGWVANLDVTRADGRPIGPVRARRRLQRLLGRIGLTVQRLSARELGVSLEHTTVWVGTRRGGIVLGSDRRRVLEAATGQGTPWVRPDFASLAARHPVALRSEGVSTKTLPPVAADLGIRTVEGLWELTFGVRVSDEQKPATHTALAATIGAIVLPHLLPGDAPTAQSADDASARP